ncbi:hypothetical protein SKAU_G00218350 [Synaphobranchus kaupii]|uniref:Uncharacterized protein n=1 Tax=Synaphobranchus kaupii TaxID=118154 RepID=A0A9Q1FAS7_SYNKA|nr:hypothetical protein SKAU_G00218350 [Synaphobranchus kaupii]
METPGLCTFRIRPRQRYAFLRSPDPNRVQFWGGCRTGASGPPGPRSDRSPVTGPENRVPPRRLSQSCFTPHKGPDTLQPDTGAMASQRHCGDDNGRCHSSVRMHQSRSAPSAPPPGPGCNGLKCLGLTQSGVWGLPQPNTRVEGLTAELTRDSNPGLLQGVLLPNPSSVRWCNESNESGPVGSDPTESGTLYISHRNAVGSGRVTKSESRKDGKVCSSGCPGRPKRTGQKSNNRFRPHKQYHRHPPCLASRVPPPNRQEPRAETQFLQETSSNSSRGASGALIACASPDSASDTNTAPPAGTRRRPSGLRCPVKRLLPSANRRGKRTALGEFRAMPGRPGGEREGLTEGREEIPGCYRGDAAETGSAVFSLCVVFLSVCSANAAGGLGLKQRWRWGQALHRESAL